MWSLLFAFLAVASAAACAAPAAPSHMPMHMPNSSAPAAPVAPVAPAVSAVPVTHGEEAAVTVSSVGSCPQDCWNESAVTAGCDPNASDDCLCGPFFDAVTDCVSQTCSIGENLEVLNTLEPLC